jgi:tRNA-Thr(GGU) m(6)t(6)A37 methyltransferase TsaA
MENQNEHRTDIEKLNILLPYWHNHGNDHIRDQEKWIKLAEKAGLKDVAGELKKAIDHSKKVNHHIAQADVCLKNRLSSQTAAPDVKKLHASTQEEISDHKPLHIHFKPIGVIRTPYTDHAPYQPVADDAGDFRIVVDLQYQEGLKDLDRFRYIYVLYYVHRAAKEPSLTVHPAWTEHTHVGVFASRSPVRPNALGLSIVQIKRIEKNQIITSGLDVFDQTPLLDIKPYIKDLDSKSDANYGWLEDFKDQDHLMMHIKGIPH